MRREGAAMLAVEIKGVKTRTAEEGEDKICHSELCEDKLIKPGTLYKRVLRHDGQIEMFHVPCFRNEFYDND